MSEPLARVGTVMLDCRDLDAMVAFWGAVLGIEERSRFPQYVWLGRISESGPALAFQKVAEAKTGKNRMHLDLGVADREAFVARAIDLGATKVEDHTVEGFTWTVMADPEGNEFCVSEES